MEEIRINKSKDQKSKRKSRKNEINPHDPPAYRDSLNCTKWKKL